MRSTTEMVALQARRVTAALAFWIAAVLFVADVSLLSGWLLSEPAAAAPAPAVSGTPAPDPLPSQPVAPGAQASPTEATTPNSPRPAAVDPEVLLDGGAAVTFPGSSTRSDQFVEVGGEDVVLSLHTLTTSDETTYSVGVIEYPDGVDLSDPAVNLLASVSGAAGNAAGRVTSQEAAVVDGAPAIEFEINTPSVRLLARNVLAGRRLYSQTVAYTGGSRPADADAFFESFTLSDQ